MAEIDLLRLRAKAKLKLASEQSVAPTMEAVNAAPRKSNAERTFDIRKKKMDVFDPLIVKHAQSQGLDPNLIRSMILVESNADVSPESTNSFSSATGLGQITKGTAKHLGITDPTDPDQNIGGIAKYLSENYDKFNGDMDKAVVAYHDGPSAVKEYERKFGADWRKGVSEEGQQHISRFNNYLQTLGGAKGNRPANSESYLDTRALAGLPPLRYEDKDANDPANVLYNNPETQAQRVQEGVQQAISDLPIREQMGSGLGAFAYKMPGMGKVAELSGLAPKGSAANKEETINDYNKNRSGMQLAGEMLPDVLISSLGGAAATKALKLGKIGKAGYTGAKALMYGAEGATAGGVSAGLHQAQHLGSGEGLKKKEAVAEIIGSALLGTLGGKLGDKFVEVAPKILRRSLRPTLTETSAVNPPDYTAALEENLVPMSGNLEKASARAEAKLSDLGTRRELAAKTASQEPSTLVPHTSPEGEVLYMNPGMKKAAVRSDSYVNEVMADATPKTTELSSLRKGAKETVPLPMKESKKVGFIDGPLKESRQSLEKEMSDPVKNKFTSETYDDAKSAFDHWEKEAMKRPTVKGHANAQMTVEDALSFRQAIDKEIRFRKSQKTLTDGFNKASLMLREDLNKTIAKVAPDVGKLTEEQAKILPFKKSLDTRVEKTLNSHLPSAGIKLSGLAGGALIGAGDSKNRKSSMLTGAIGGLTLAQLATTPGGAAILFKAGKALQNNSLKKATFNQLIRSGAVKSRDN